MFKKKNIKKDQVLDQVLKKKEDAESDSDPEVNEPVVKKKVRKVDFKYSTKEQTEEYEKLVNEYTDELKYKARPDLITKDKGNAFATLDINTDHLNDTKSLKLRQMEISKLKKEGKLDGKYYMGESGYAIYAEKSEKDIHNSKYTGSLGPIRGPSNVRASCRIDYNPSLCKDWHETGYCGFGDSCIFIHDRTDYKSGWELEKEWEKEQAEKAKKLVVSTKGLADDSPEEQQEEEDEDGLPKKCQICEGNFKSPVYTNCKHYFCEKCIFNRYKEDKSCPVCNTLLNGNFNIAKEIIEKFGLDIKEKQSLKQKNRIKIGEKKEKAEDESEDEGEGLDGVDFGDIKDKKGKEKSFEKVAQEFKKSLAGSKERFQSETDWHY